MHITLQLHWTSRWHNNLQSVHNGVWALSIKINCIRSGLLCRFLCKENCYFWFLLPYKRQCCSC